MKTWAKWVLVIILLAGLAVLVPQVRRVFFAPADMLDAVSTGMEIKRLQAMIKGFEKKFQRLPTEEEFENLTRQNIESDRTDGLRSNGLVDMWGEPYTYYRLPNGGFVIKSVGPDRKPETKDDVILLRR